MTDGGQPVAQNRIDDCIFCECRPCRCVELVRPGRKAAQRVPSSAVVRESRPPAAPDAHAPTTPKLIAKRLKPPSAPTSVAVLEAPLVKTRPEVRDIRSQEETDLRMALTALADAELLCAEDLVRERNRIELPKWRIDALIWRQT